MVIFSVVYRVGKTNGRGSLVLVCNIAINDAMQFMKAVNQGGMVQLDDGNVTEFGLR
jgi:hypothetical protein